MNIIREDVGSLNAILKVQLTPEDYAEKVKETLNKYRKTAKIPGFRPGHVPFGLVEKQYGKAVLSEELNKVVNDSLYKYIAENKIEILGNPIPSKEGDFKGDFNKPSDFEFTYEIGLAPEVNVSLSGKSKYDYVKVKVDDKLINEQITDLQRRYGKLISKDETGEGDMILGQFVELNDDESIKEGGIMHSSTISLQFLENKEAAKALLGKKVGDKVVVDPADVSRDAKDTASMLGISVDQLENTSNKFQLTVNEIKGMELAELNSDLFDKLFGEDAVTDEKELRERIKSDLEGMFSNDSDKILTRDIYQDLLNNVEVNLPDEFLKRWIKMSNEKEITEEQIEAEYDGYAKGLKWQLIQGNIFKTNNIELNHKELLEYVKGLLVGNYAQYGIPAPDDNELAETASRVLQNREESSRLFDMLAEQKLMKFFKDTVKLNEKEVSYDEFMELASK